LFRIEYVAFDLAGFQDIQREGLKDGFSSQRKSKRFHATEEASLLVSHARQ